MNGWRTRLDGLTGREAAAIFALGVPEVLAELGLGSALTGARAKVLATLPAGLREYASRVSDRFHLDAPGWFHRPEEVGELATVASAVADARRLRVRYGRRDRTVERELEPLGLVVKAGVWYLVALPVHTARPVDTTQPVDTTRPADTAQPVDTTRPADTAQPVDTTQPIDTTRPADTAQSGDGGGPRTYRVARVEEAVVGASFERPEFDLGSWWAQTSARFERSLLRERVRLRLSPRARRMLPDVTDREAAAEALADAGPEDADGWCEVELAVESERVALTQLTALGVGVEILEPASVRAAMAEIGAEIAARHGGSAGARP
jgi:predicted DNA-binding transcriptional regulator YafY